MTGIYKITNPKGKVYIGQSVDMLKRQKTYSKLDCKGQPKLYNSLVKYGFSKHVFEIVEQCTITDLNIRERYWQDFYNVLSDSGLNCTLTSTIEAKQVRSQESIRKSLLGFKEFIKTPEGAAMQLRKIVRYKSYLQTPEGIEMKVQRANKIKSSSKVFNTDYRAIAKKNRKPIEQYSRQGVFIQKWDSSTEASQVTGINQGSISSCCKQKLKSAGGFIWKYRI